MRVILRVSNVVRAAGSGNALFASSTSRSSTKIYHTGVQVHDQLYEYGEDGLSEALIDTRIPYVRNFSTSTYLHSKDMGVTTRTANDIRRWIDSNFNVFTKERYSALYRNCNHFSDLFLVFLNGSHVPEYILNQAHRGGLGVAISAYTRFMADDVFFTTVIPSGLSKFAFPQISALSEGVFPSKIPSDSIHSTPSTSPSPKTLGLRNCPRKGDNADYQYTDKPDHLHCVDRFYLSD